ncbi:MAG: paraquat-inducible protein A [Geminicoccaceae bacterium]|nr:MAG: paraquat-inducible protein A [Geminicoccaceae bacterium]
MSSYVACHDCGAVHRREPLAPGRKARCRRCGSTLYRRRHDPLNRGIAFLSAALVLWLLVHVLPLLTLRLDGAAHTATLHAAVRAIADAGLWPLALMVLAFVSLVPGTKILSSLIAAIAARQGWRHPIARLAFTLGQRQTPWAMLEIFLLGLIVAYVKLAALARVELEAGLVLLALTILCIAAADAVLEPEAVWSRIGRPTPPVPAPDRGVACHTCHWLAPAVARRCPRCNATLHHRKARSLQRSWAFLIAAAVLYIPANLYPMMIISQLGRTDPTTILGGVVDLFAAQLYGIAVIVFVASILVPVAKIVGLAWLLIATQRRSADSLRSRTRAYAAIEFVGRWSMVDVFMVAILASLVNVPGLLSIEPGIGAFAFASVVILTMFASASYDPRLAWDGATVRHGHG